MDYETVKWLHVLSAALLVGTGFGSAFYLYFANRTRNVQAISVVARHVVLADWIFTAPSVVFQPLSGFYLAHQAGFELLGGWIGWSLMLYVLAGACWLPVVWLQIRMRDIAHTAAVQNIATLPPTYWRYAHLWMMLGWPAFSAMVVIYYLMIVKP